jgi:hypothetical protein
MVTGAMAASYYGRPRTTLDMDVIVSIPTANLTTLVKALARAHLNVQEDKLLSALKSQNRIATIEDKKSPHTLDIIFMDEELDRSPGHILGVRTYYQTPESLILAKLKILKVTLEEERASTDREDIRAILKTTKVNLKTLRTRTRRDRTVELLDDLTMNPAARRRK